MLTPVEDELRAIAKLEKLMETALLAIPATPEALAVSNEMSQALRREPQSISDASGAAMDIARSDAERAAETVQMALVKDLNATLALPSAVTAVRDKLARWKREAEKLRPD